MKIVKIGTFDDQGIPTGWNLDLNNEPGVAATISQGSETPSTIRYVLGIDMLYPGSVDVNGVEIKEWSVARKQAQQR